ncbi:MAG: 2'-5' RNA ligase family protein [Firmicutes bacterium]|nr:2'-5' RNA ligase family protein [Bacillota bacterium]
MGTHQRSVLCLIPEHGIQGLERFRRQYINHSGRDIPFHVTLLDSFPLPAVDEANKLKRIARETSRFEFVANPISSFPTTNVLYLTPSPLAPIEELTQRLYRVFPEFRPQTGFPVFHMTVALGNPEPQNKEIIATYFAQFGKQPLPLRAKSLSVYTQSDEQWHRCLTAELG